MSPLDENSISAAASTTKLSPKRKFSISPDSSFSSKASYKSARRSGTSTISMSQCIGVSPGIEDCTLSQSCSEKSVPEFALSIQSPKESKRNNMLLLSPVSFFTISMDADHRFMANVSDQKSKSTSPIASATSSTLAEEKNVEHLHDEKDEELVSNDKSSKIYKQSVLSNELELIHL